MWWYQAQFISRSGEPYSGSSYGHEPTIARLFREASGQIRPLLVHKRQVSATRHDPVRLQTPGRVELASVQGSDVLSLGLGLGLGGGAGAHGGVGGRMVMHERHGTDRNHDHDRIGREPQRSAPANPKSNTPHHHQRKAGSVRAAGCWVRVSGEGLPGAVIASFEEVAREVCFEEHHACPRAPTHVSGLSNDVAQTAARRMLLR